jgi:hypothetical protein
MKIRPNESLSRILGIFRGIFNGLNLAGLEAFNPFSLLI